MKPIHPLVKRLWEQEKYKISTATEAARRSGESASTVASTIDVERMNALIERIEHTAEKIGVRPSDFLAELLEYIQENERKIS
ncbi:MAG: hypothetical protein EKK48_12050 [Candidatus Melainabacteria bacterium]|nr:MAG: hypothetical protein EKK48_12050 [Candidatus Melainabacteria bacterium]